MPPACGSASWSACRCRRRQPDRTVLTVRGKGDKERMVPIGGAAREALAAWLTVRPFYVLDPTRARWLFPPRGAAAT